MTSDTKSANASVSPPVTTLGYQVVFASPQSLATPAGWCPDLKPIRLPTERLHIGEVGMGGWDEGERRTVGEYHCDWPMQESSPPGKGFENLWLDVRTRGFGLRGWSCLFCRELVLLQQTSNELSDQCMRGTDAAAVLIGSLSLIHVLHFVCTLRPLLFDAHRARVHITSSQDRLGRCSGCISTRWLKVKIAQLRRIVF